MLECPVFKAKDLLTARLLVVKYVARVIWDGALRR